jgi:hypothetical protein
MGPFLKAVTKVVLFFEQKMPCDLLNTKLPVFTFNVKFFNSLPKF